VDKVLPVLVILGVLILVFGGLALAWRARRSRQAGLPALDAPPSDAGAIALVDDLLYVATTRADAPLDRITVSGLAFRSRATITVTESGIRLDLAGSAPAFVPRAALRGVGRATWTVDRVVNRDGLVFVRWVLGDSELDSYLRSAEPDALVAAITDLLTPLTKEPHS
jgi:hypothetical protein